MNAGDATVRQRAGVAALAGAFVACVQLWLVAIAGTDVPFHDQWDVEGGALLPAAREQAVPWTQVLRPHNEHRIAWTQLLNLALVRANGGQWDPLVQQAANAWLHGLLTALLVVCASAGASRRGLVAAGAAIALGCVPFAGWHNALWGFQSQVYFAIGFSVLAICLLVDASVLRSGRFVAGVAAAVSAQWAMGPGFLVPVALLAWEGVRWLDGRRDWRRWICWLVLLGGALLLRRAVPAHDGLRASSPAEFFEALGRVLAWPHTSQPWAAVVILLPLALLLLARIAGRVPPHPGRDRVLAVALWVVSVAMATAWTRGGSAEFVAGVPSRYADFLVLMPLTGAGALAWAWPLVVQLRRRMFRIGAAAWGVFVFVGWLGLSAEAWRRVIGPRAADRSAPERLMAAFQQTGDATVYAGLPRLLIPHPNLEAVARVLSDPRLDGTLPPSMQPERPLGPLSRGLRRVLHGTAPPPDVPADLGRN
jgi:hypothetical protein